MDATPPKSNITDNGPDDSKIFILLHSLVTFANYEWDYIKASTINSLPTCRNCHTAT